MNLIHLNGDCVSMLILNQHESDLTLISSCNTVCLKGHNLFPKCFFVLGREMNLFKMGKIIQIKRVLLGNWSRAVSGEMAQKLGRVQLFHHFIFIREIFVS